MSIKPKTLNKGDIEAQLRAHGLSRRDAVLVLDFILAEVSAALARGEDVEFALGKLKLAPHRHRTQEGKFLGKTRTIYRQRNTVVHEMNEKGDRLLNPPPPKPRLALPPKPWEKPEEKKINLHDAEIKEGGSA